MEIGIDTETRCYAIVGKVTGIGKGCRRQVDGEGIACGLQIVVGAVDQEREFRPGGRQRWAFTCRNVLDLKGAVTTVIVLHQHHPVAMPEMTIVARVTVLVFINQRCIVKVWVGCNGKGQNPLFRSKADGGAIERGRPDIAEDFGARQLTRWRGLRCTGFPGYNLLEDQVIARAIDTRPNEVERSVNRRTALGDDPFRRGGWRFRSDGLTTTQEQKDGNNAGPLTANTLDHRLKSFHELAM